MGGDFLMGILSTSTMWEVLSKAMGETLYMVFWSTLFSVVLALIPAFILVLTAPDGLHPMKGLYEVLSFIINVFRSFPFIILLVMLVALIIINIRNNKQEEK